MQDKSQQNPNIVKLETICDSMASRLTTAAKTLKQELDQSAREKSSISTSTNSKSVMSPSSNVNHDAIIITHERDILQYAKILHDNHNEIYRIIKEMYKNGKAAVELRKLINNEYIQLEKQIHSIEIILELIRKTTNLHADIAKKDSPLFFALKIESYKTQLNNLKNALKPLLEDELLLIKEADSLILSLLTKKIMMGQAANTSSASELNKVARDINELEESRISHIINYARKKLNPAMLDAEISKQYKELQALEIAKDSMEPSDYKYTKSTLTERLSKCEKALETIQEYKNNLLVKKVRSGYTDSLGVQAPKDEEKKATIKERRLNITSVQPTPPPPISTAIPKKNTAPPDIKHSRRQP